MQWEFAGRLGPAPGRYVVRRYAGDEVREVVVVDDGAAPARRWRRRSAAAVVGTVPVTRVTVVDAGGASGAADPDDEAWFARASACLARFLAAYRVAAADPSAPADARRALLARVGVGTGDELARGEWSDARVVALPAENGAGDHDHGPGAERPRRIARGGARGSRRSKHRPDERLAAVMAARDVVLACEELTLRARGDLDAGRDPEAALQLEAALGAALSELASWVGSGDLAERVAELRGYEDAVCEAAAAAREGRLESPGVEAVATALGRLEAALRARALYAAE
ncbi:MAG TPA: hypothetical protein VNS09_14205 [Solirubrobacter sp.]|nr:hypothetical protein [Solirubrobacter sp.]